MMTLPEETIIPQDQEAERVVLATVLHYPQDFAGVESILQPEDFMRETNQTIYRAMINLHRGNARVEPAAVFRELTRSGDADRFKITRLALEEMSVNFSMISGMPAHFAERIREQAIRRRLWQQGEQMIREALDEQNDVEDVITGVGQRLSALSGGGIARASVATIGEYAEQTYSDYYKAATEKKPLGLRTGWTGINGFLRPFQPGQLIAISADTGIGKTAWSMNLAVDLAKQKKRGLVFSYEMNGKALSLRAALMRMNYTQDELDTIDTQQDANAILLDLHAQVQALKGLPLRIDHDSGNTPTKIERAIQDEMRQFGKLDYVIVDYIGMVPTDSRRKRYEELGEISRFFKALPQKYGFVMFVLCQLATKNMAQRPCRRPQLEDVYESGRIPQDCDMFLSLYWPGRYGVNELKKAGYDPTIPLHWHTVEVLAPKTRGGLVKGKFPRTAQRYDNEHVRYYDLLDAEWKLLPFKGGEA